MEVCSSAPLEVEASKLEVVSLSASPGKVTVKGAADEYYVDSDIIQLGFVMIFFSPEPSAFLSLLMERAATPSSQT